MKLDALSERVERVEAAVYEIQREVIENTDITRDVRDALVAGKVMARVIKWAGVVAAGCSAVWVAFYQFTHQGKSP